MEKNKTTLCVIRNIQVNSNNFCDLFECKTNGKKIKRICKNCTHFSEEKTKDKEV
jgi:hypothetical protein